MPEEKKAAEAKPQPEKAILDPIAALESSLIAVALPEIQAVQTAFLTISTSKGDPVVFAQQQAIIVASVNALLLQAPVILPILQAQAIAAGAGLAAEELAKIIAQLQQIQAGGTPASVKK